jgi:3,4-dihydroxy-2-butanone 4-phosphate synthase
MSTAAQFDPIEDVIRDIRAGRMVVVTDDADRENEATLSWRGEDHARGGELHGDAWAAG